MKFTIERAPLLRALTHLAGVVERRSSVPVLGNVLIRADGQGVQLSATDMDIELVESVSAQVGAEGVTTTPVRTLYDILRKLREGAQVEIDAEKKGSLALRSGRSSFSIPTLPAEDFPSMQAGGLTHTFRLPAADLRALIDRTKFAISTEETRYYLNGIYLHDPGANEAPILRGVATDGHRLARADVALPDGAAGMPGVIVPRKTVIELRKLIDGEGDIEVSVSKSKIRFVTPGATMTSKLIDGTYPDYNRVIPAGNDKVVEIGREDFTAAIDRVSTITTERTRAVKLAIDRNGLVVSATSSENGAAVEELEVRYQSDPIEMGFNSRYLLDIAGQIEEDELQFTLADAASPALIAGVGNSSALYVLMPMRV